MRCPALLRLPFLSSHEKVVEDLKAHQRNLHPATLHSSYFRILHPPSDRHLHSGTPGCHPAGLRSGCPPAPHKSSIPAVHSCGRSSILQVCPRRGSPVSQLRCGENIACCVYRSPLVVPPAGRHHPCVYSVSTRPDRYPYIWLQDWH